MDLLLSLSAYPKTVIGLSIATVVVAANHIRIKRSKRAAVVVVRATSKTRKPHPIVIIPGTAQSSAVWEHRMQLIANNGYDCHCLNLTQDGNWTSSYGTQIATIRNYVDKLCDRPILIGHSQGGTKVQNYLLGKDGDCRAENQLCGAVLLGSSILDYSQCGAPIIQNMMGLPMALACTAVCLFGGMEQACFFGGGMFRHQLRTYASMFNAETTTTTLVGGSAAPVSLKQFGDILDGHEPTLTDFGAVEYSCTPSDVTGERGCQVLVMSGACDRVVPMSMVQANAEMWGTKPVWVQGQGHELGDVGWEREVMGPLFRFLDSLPAK